MNIPTQFQEELSNTFHNRYRLRWSDKLHQFCLEQKVLTGQIIPPPVDEDNNFDTYDDSWIRARDGYFLTMIITVGDRMPCPVCHSTLKVPVMETRETVCEKCKASGIDGRYVAAYYPLNSVLLDHIRDIDPDNGGPIRVGQRIRAKQVGLNERKLKYDLDEAHDEVIENQEQIEQRPWVGFGGNKSRNVMDW